MARFVTIGYGDREGYERASPEARAAAHERDAQLWAAGAIGGVVGEPVQVRNHEGCEMEVRRGSFVQPGLPIAGIAIIEAVDLDEAIQLVSATPCAVAYGVVEVWPVVA